jgi:hypothetical protein
METEKKPVASLDGTPAPCPECRGRGWLDKRCLTPETAHRCPYCDGRGTNVMGRVCYACKGTGLMEVRLEDKHACPTCGGAGVFPVPESMTSDQFAFHPTQLHKPGRTP